MATYRAVWGDKNTFRLALALAGAERSFQQASENHIFTFEVQLYLYAA